MRRLSQAPGIYPESLNRLASQLDEGKRPLDGAIAGHLARQLLSLSDGDAGKRPFDVHGLRREGEGRVP